MRFEDWEPFYLEILKDFGYSRAEDERSARVLDECLGGERTELNTLSKLLSNKQVRVAGNAQSLVEELQSKEGVLICADEATSIALGKGIIPDVLVTDLDGRVRDQVLANKKGAIAVIHAHGDNVAAVKRWAPQFEGSVVGTTQSRPFGRIYNFGGFTDGDRAVFLAHHFQASKISLLGFDFEHPSPKDENPATKLRKLGWARKLIQSIGVL